MIPQSTSNDRELARAKIPSPSFFLLRPDGHVGLCGARLDGMALTRYLSEHVHLKAQVMRPQAA